MLKKILFLNLAIAALFAVTSPAFASYGNPCQAVYGGYGGGDCNMQGNILLNKVVLNPQTGKYQDNLGMNDAKYSVGDNVSFELIVTNTGNSAISSTTVSDNFPMELTDVKGPGSYNASTRVLSFTVSNLMPNETRIFTVSGKANSQSSVCPINQASAVAGDQASQDSSKFCIGKAAVLGTTKGGLPIMQAPAMKQTPSTGPEMLSLIGLIPAAGAGLFLRRRSEK